MTTDVSVDLPGREYLVRIGPGALEACRPELRRLTAKPSAIVADEAVLAQHEDALRKVLPELPLITVPSGEATKSWQSYADVSEKLLEAGVERGGSVVAFGGGVTGDLAGFCAATLRRGCRLVMLPTTLLSQVDSSVGGKTAINTASGKNLVGAFHQPSLVAIDTSFLSTLPKRELLAGYAEVIKYGALGDPQFLSWLGERGDAVLALEPAALTEAIAVSCRAKAAIVTEDETERGRRALLNLGHTFGHAIEAEGQYDGRILHGEGVAIGMVMAARFSEREGHLSPGEAERFEALVARSGLPTRLADVPDIPADPGRLLLHMRQDKKVDSGAMTLILLKRLGEAFVAKDQDEARILDFLGEEAQLPKL
ncbi:3-dehydroquinate synthase [Parvularcula sp. ZS-1/3]|uniref:3-dehydroquinate synthase n=1 Tax=Parvularcula mediterranea TaxID=2732508 RepID=A0A7Y3RKA6_9PROT|nr:3-dehydroquinate synthase [Parvularcula mediterranea]NNU15240.1 3-dehydroquinate synthase [Parvularcula mediterranea]